MKLVISEDVRNDLVDIGKFIAKNNPARASTFVDELLDCCFSLTSMPEAYQLLPRYEEIGIRRFPHGNYSIFYIASETTVKILRILYGTRNYEQLLLPDTE